jgi:hypothetical protein
VRRPFKEGAVREGDGRSVDREEERVDTWVWIVIAVAVLVVLVLLFALRGRMGSRRVERKREHADELRHEARQRMGSAGEREATAQQEAERARREREAAEDALRRADEVDPDVPDADRR